MNRSALAAAVLFAGAQATTVSTARAEGPSATTPANSSSPAAPSFLDRPDGRIAYSDSGGPGEVVLCVPGMGDVRQTWRFLTPLLVARGYRVVAMDIRGHGDSSASFEDLSAAAVGSDAVALLQKLSAGPAVIAGNSMAGAAAVWAAAERPDLVKALVLIDPFVRDLPPGLIQQAMLKVALLRPWGPAAWGSYYASLYVTNKPSDLDSYRDTLVRTLKEPGRIEATRGMVWASKTPCEKRLPEVKAPTMVIMGSLDPDFADPQAEAHHVANALHGDVLMVKGSGHYPQSEQPEVVASAIERMARSPM